MKNKILNPISMLIIGATLGILSKLFDIYTEVLGNIFSEFPIWILIGTIIAIYSDTKSSSMLNIFPFCIGMLFSYYLTAELTNSIYSISFIKGWTIFAFFSPLFAYFTWLTKEKGIFPKIISTGIIGISIFSSLFIFSFNIFDILINLILIYILLIKKVRRNAYEK